MLSNHSCIWTRELVTSLLRNLSSLRRPMSIWRLFILTLNLKAARKLHIWYKTADSGVTMLSS